MRRQRRVGRGGEGATTCAWHFQKFHTTQHVYMCTHAHPSRTHTHTERLACDSWQQSSLNALHERSHIAPPSTASSCYTPLPNSPRPFGTAPQPLSHLTYNLMLCLRTQKSRAPNSSAWKSLIYVNFACARKCASACVCLSMCVSMCVSLCVCVFMPASLINFPLTQRKVRITIFAFKQQIRQTI